MRTARKEGQEKEARSFTLRGRDPDEFGSLRVGRVVYSVWISGVQTWG